MDEADDLYRSLDRLVALGRNPDLNIRPVLLRVLVDLFVRKPHHAPADLAQFEEITLRLFDAADDETRLIVADKLSRHPSLPKSLIGRFLAERGSLATRALEHADLDLDTLSASAAWGTLDMAAAIARRKDLSLDVARALVDRPEREVVMTLAANLAAPLDRPLFQSLVRRARGDDDMGRLLLLRQDGIPADLAPLFLLASGELRASILLSAHRDDFSPETRRPKPNEAEAAALLRVERALMLPDQDSFDTALAGALGLPLEEVWRLIDDRFGEPLAVALAAIGASPEFAARVFILSGPAIGHSVMSVRSLTAIVDTLPVRTARRLVAAMAGSPQRPERRAQHEPASRSDRRREGEARPAQSAMASLERRLSGGRQR